MSRTTRDSLVGGRLLSVATILIFGSFQLVGCSADITTENANGSGAAASGPNPAAGYSVGGQVTGLSGTGLMLQMNGIYLDVKASGSFVFPGGLASGASYSVMVQTQPVNPAQICTVSNGVGTVGTSNVTNVGVACTTQTTSNNGIVTVSGTITGLAGTGLSLQTNGVTVPISGDTFSVPLSTGSAYNIVVTTQPTAPTQTCTVANGSGTANANVTNVAVSCTTQTFTVSGTITNLLGTGIVVQNNGTAIALNGSSFSLTLASGTPYAITVGHQPVNPSQTCTPSNGSGTVGSANVVVPIACVTNTYTITVIASGLPNGAQGLTALDNGANSLAVTGNGSFTFAGTVPSGQPYAVTVGAQPTGTPLPQYCLIPNGAGTVTTANVSVTLTCRNIGQALFAANSEYDPRNNGPGDISGFRINPGSGNLVAAAGSPYGANSLPSGLSLDTQNQILYAINNVSNDISTYRVAPATGVLTGLQVAPGYPTSGAFGGGFSVLVNPQAPNFVYAGSDQNPFGVIDLFNVGPGATLSAPNPTQAGNDPEFMALNPSGTLLFAPQVFDDDILVFSIGVTGTLQPAPASPFAAAPNGIDAGPAALAVHPTAHFLYVAGLFNATITAYSYDDSGDITALAPAYTFGAGTAGGIFGGDGVAIDPTSRWLYVTSPMDNTVVQYSIATQTGLLTQVGAPVATGASPSDVKIDPSGHYLYVANWADGTISEYLIDPVTGALTEAQGSPFQSGPGTKSIAIE